MSDVLVPHPYASVVVDHEAGVANQVRLYCPVPGDQLRQVRIANQPDPSLFELLVQIAKATSLDDIECSEEQAEFLISVGFLVRPEDAARTRFPCTVDQGVLEGLPKRVAPVRALAKELVVNPTLVAEHERDDTWSDHGASLGASFPARRVWLDDPRTGQHVPYGRSPLLDRLLEHGAGRSVAVEDDQARRLLLLAGALVDPEAAAATAIGWAGSVDAGRAGFARDRYCVVRDVLPPLQLAALRLHYRVLVAQGCFPFGDSQVERRYWAYQERIARFYHHLLTPLTTAIAGRPVKPSYAYFASYVPGAKLERHVDREQCEISLSFLVDYSPDPDDVSDWPIFVESPASPGRVTPIELGPGDALFYKGCEVHHHREPLLPGRSSTSLFFHYVPADSTAPLA